MLSALALAAALTGVLELTDRTELRLRDPGVDPNAASFDVETTPEARLTLRSRRMRYVLGYAPRLSSWDLNITGVHPVLLHNATASAEWRSSRTTRLTLSETGSYGGMSFASLVAVPGPEGAPPRVDVIPVSRVLRFASSQTTLASQTTLGRWAVATSIGYELSGGADPESRTILPFQSGPVGEVKVERALTRTDHLGTTVSAFESSFSSGPEIAVVEAVETWRHAFARTTEARLTAGAAEARVRASAFAAPSLDTHAVAELALDERQRIAGGRFDVRIAARLAPVVNRLLGIVDERAQATVDARWTHGRYALHADGSVAQSVPSSSATAVRLAIGEVAAAYRVTDVLALDLGVRGLWQRQAQLAQPASPGGEAQISQVTFLQGVLFLGATLRAPPTVL